MADWARLEIACPIDVGPWVRIPSSPPCKGWLKVFPQDVHDGDDEGVIQGVSKLGLGDVLLDISPRCCARIGLAAVCGVLRTRVCWLREGVYKVFLYWMVLLRVGSAGGMSYINWEIFGSGI